MEIDDPDYLNMLLAHGLDPKTRGIVANADGTRHRGSSGLTWRDRVDRTKPWLYDTAIGIKVLFFTNGK